MALLDGEALGDEQLGDLLGRDRAEEVPLGVALHLDRDRRPGELGHELGALLGALGLEGGLDGLVLLDEPQVLLRGEHRDPVREEVVAGVARADLHDLADAAEALDAAPEEDFERGGHGGGSCDVSGPRRAAGRGSARA